MPLDGRAHARVVPAGPFRTLPRPSLAVGVLGLLLVHALGAWPSAAKAQGGGRPLVIEDFYRLKSVGNPAISPDGRWVAYTVETRLEATNTQPSEVWLASTDGTPLPRRVSELGADARNPQWQEDGRLSFATNGVDFALDPSAPDRVTRVEAPARAQRGTAGASARPLVSPDGRMRAVLRDLPPARREVTFATDFERRHEARFKGRQFDWLEFQRDGQPYPVPNRTDPTLYPPQELFVATGGGVPERQLTRLGLRPTNVSWTSDGTRLVFTADSAYRNERTYGSTEIYSVTTDGAVKRLTSDRAYTYSGAAPSPDGRWILSTRQFSTDHVIARKLNHGGARDLVVIAAAGGEERVLTADWDYLPSDASWSPDGRHVYFQGGVGGTVHLFRVAVAGGAVEQVTTGERRILGLSIDKGYRRMAYLVGRIEAPAEVHVANIDGSGERQLTSVHQDFVREVGLSKAERLQFASRDGTPVEGWLLYPRGYRADRGPYPLVVSNHGGPHAADGYSFDFKSQYFAANGYFVLKVNFRSSTGYGEKFLWATWGAWGDRDGEDVMAGIDHAIARARIDRNRVASIGHSYGGFMTNWLITQYPDRFVAAVPGAGIVNWVSDYGTADIARTKETEFFGTPWEEAARNIMIRQSPLTYAGRVKAATLFVHGEEDERVPYSEAEQMYVALKKNGVPAKMIQYAGMAHGIIGSWNQVHRMLNELRWLDQYLKTASAS
jgi:dipeptidyl aminopeptidase/acylaminoacyl peptidase